MVMTHVKIIFLLSITFADQQLGVGAGTEGAANKFCFIVSGVNILAK